MSQCVGRVPRLEATGDLRSVSVSDEGASERASPEGLNQIEIWFSILMRKLLKRASFYSKDHLKTRIEDFIDYFNRTMAKPFKWTYKGKVLAV